MPDPNALHLIYDSILNADSFAALPEYLNNLVGARSCWLIWQHPGSDFSVEAQSGYWDSSALRFYAEYGAQADPLIAASQRPDVINNFGRATDIVGQSTFLGSAFYNEHVRETGTDTYWVAGASFDTPGGTGTIGLHRTRGMGDFEPEMMAQLDALAPHLRRALAMRAEIGSLRGLALAARPERGVIHLDAEARIVMLDEGGDWLLRSHPRFAYHDGRMALRGSAAPRLAAALRRAVRPRAPGADIVFVTPERAGDLAPPVQLNIFPSTSNPGHAVIVALMRVAEAGPPPELIVEPPRLTNREAQMFHLLARGQRRDRIAHDLGISLPTVDLHVSKLRIKLGARTIAEAIAHGYEWGLR